MSTITVAAIEPKPKRSIVVTTEGRRLGCYTEKLAKWGIEIGATYNIETVEVRLQDGTVLTNIGTASRGTTGSETERLPFQSGAYRPPVGSPLATPQGNSGFYRPTHPRDAQRMFVTKLLGDAITGGQVPFDLQNMTAAANVLMEVWRRTIGREEMPFTEAAE